MPIDSVEELSIEHKIPWLNNSSELFWDLDNIAFSHLICNTRAADKTWAKGNTFTRKTCNVELNSWCSICKQELSKDCFSKDASRWNGLEKYCKTCRSLKRSNN